MRYNTMENVELALGSVLFLCWLEFCVAYSMRMLNVQFYAIAAIKC